MAEALRQVLGSLSDDATRVPAAAATALTKYAPQVQVVLPPGLADPPLDPDMLRSLEDQLRIHFGPIAPVILRVAADRNRSAEELWAELALTISDEAERERFRNEVQRVLPPRRAPTAGASSRDDSGNVGSRLPKQELERVLATFIQFVGPIARVLVQRAVANATSVESLANSCPPHRISGGAGGVPAKTSKVGLIIIVTETGRNAVDERLSTLLSWLFEQLSTLLSWVSEQLSTLLFWMSERLSTLLSWVSSLMARYRADGLAGLTDTETTLALGLLWLTFMVAATNILYFGARLREQMRSAERATERFVKIGEKLAFARQLRADVDHPEKFNEMAEEAVLIARAFDAAKAELPRSWWRYRLTIIFGSLVAVVAVLSGFHIGGMSRQSLSDLSKAPAFVQATIQTNPGLAGLLIQVEFITIVIAFSIALGMLILMRDKEENRRALETADTIVKMFACFLIGVGSFFFGINALVDRYKGMESHSVQLEQDVAAARERTMELEQEVSTARGRAVALEQEVSAARERAVALEREASTARERAVAFEQAAREATEQAARAARESPAASEKVRTPRFDAAEIKQRLADLGKLVRAATVRAVDPTQGNATETPRPVQEEATPGNAAASRNGQPSPIVSRLGKYAGTKAAVFVLDQVPDAPVTGSTISAYLSDAGWAPQTWTWTGVAGISAWSCSSRKAATPRRPRPRPPSWRPCARKASTRRRETGRRTGAGSAAHSTVRKHQARRKLLSGSSSGQNRVDLLTD